MCGRYFFDGETAKEIEDELELSPGLITTGVGDVTPAMSPAVITAGRGSDGASLKVSDMFWGVTGNDKKLVINARAESALEKPMFTDSVERRRLVIPASGFYEWDKDKNKVTFYKKDKSPIYLAGFYKLSDNKDSFVILTTAANESLFYV
ncbi:MAG: SOS response-associated peptidase family protein [Butyrivibrio sp.]|nr:SOS response-associated peptidase family protein [Butyrivibrio sp.]MBR1640957.1 SOS response-associated peptidase family protein [Butyrivibrio sp.]